jgi:glycosyltransferase involved in cell wall biosynthesis
MLHPSSAPVDSLPAIVCLSHLRWNFVFQRPQHLMTRCALERPVYFVEEPIYRADTSPQLCTERCDGVTVVVPVLPEGLTSQEYCGQQRLLLRQLLQAEHLTEYVLWYYTPMALPFTDDLEPAAIVYDCMDELSAFKDAPPALKELEAALMRRAGLVLTGGHSLYEAKRHQHPNIHPFPSSVDITHFAAARHMNTDAHDQAPIPHPRLGFFGVIDERLDAGLVEAVAAARPDWQLVMIGPVVKIDPQSLPQRPNIHYLGAKRYEELPRYLAGWDVALLPFACNEATRFISPTKTPEYLAAGKPVVSTPIQDVVRPYGHEGLVHIAAEASAFVQACEAAMAEDAFARITHADAFLRHMSWDGTWARIRLLMDAVVGNGAARGRDDHYDSRTVQMTCE